MGFAQPRWPVARVTIALIDCNAFYCSVEVLFQPWLRDRPVVVASSNDGCVVSRNDPAKALGIKMGQPVFELRDQMARNEVKIFSSNFELYQSVSNRVMAVLDELAPRIFVYSVDESFADLTGIADPEAWGRHARDEIQTRLGLGVGVGIAPTKTLAKLANWAAKRWKAKSECVVDLRDPVRQEKLLRYAKVGEVWGIGPRLNARLADIGINSAWQLATADPKLLRRQFNVNVERTARELLGLPCFPFVDGSPDRKQMIACTRSFGGRILSLDLLEGAVATFTGNVAAKLRQQSSLANCLQVFARSSPFDTTGEHYSASRIVAMPYPTDDTRDLTNAALSGLRALFRAGPRYAKAGVILSQFVERGSITDDLFAPKPRPNSEQLMRVMDAINAKQGRGTLRLACDPVGGSWSMRRELLSPAYTTSWMGLQQAKC
ncbi:translesion error-prone DNA polymerase V subunit UmuC [Pseudomonas sp. 2FE]|uniref:translesion error-prone DNA polymerase V subunit UmuC n=1 Tax=Pseudomonas sp. 2FE TaxID=2502190 RepID=UPI0010F767CB|nr:translesion error-prone DNA polymerase V subunit UmuC [Pseudomonas sp. 2FE]